MHFDEANLSLKDGMLERDFLLAEMLLFANCSNPLKQAPRLDCGPTETNGQQLKREIVSDICLNTPNISPRISPEGSAQIHVTQSHL